MPLLLPIHVAAGGLAIVLGALALIVRKGGTIHRRSGLLFVYAMFVMGTTGALLGFLENGPLDGNVFAGFVVAYFVATALLTVRPESSWTRRLHAVALAVAVAGVLQTIRGAVDAFDGPRGPVNGIVIVHFFLATVMLLAAAGDVRILRSGMHRGGQRLARHLWRMCFALFIAAGSFFSIRERVATILPEPMTTGAMRALPILLLFATMLYWLWRVRRAPRVMVRHEPLPLPSPWPSRPE